MAGKRKKRPGRGRPSTIDRLPEDVRVQIHEQLRSRRMTQQEILEDINPRLAKRGEKQISKSALGRYSMAVEKNGSMMREARAAADALVGGLGEQKGTDLGRAVTEMVKTLTFNLVVNDGELDVDTINKVALIAQRIERASKISLEREDKVRKQAQEEAAAAALSAMDRAEASDQAMTPEKYRQIIHEAYGV